MCDVHEFVSFQHLLNGDVASQRVSVLFLPFYFKLGTDSGMPCFIYVHFCVFVCFIVSSHGRCACEIMLTFIPLCYAFYVDFCVSYCVAVCSIVVLRTVYLVQHDLVVTLMFDAISVAVHMIFVA